MPRRPRSFLEGVPLHVHHRGNNRTDIFRDDYDRVVFLRMMLESSRHCDVAIHNWVLMTTHFHILATPAAGDSLPKMMQQLGGRYVPYFNRRYERTGTLWEGRYGAHLVDSELYWFRCARYIELNPVRAGVVQNAREYRWSSYRSLGCGTLDIIITPHPTYIALGSSDAERQAAYRSLCGSELTTAELASVRTAMRTGRVIVELGDAESPSNEVRLRV